MATRDRIPGEDWGDPTDPTLGRGRETEMDRIRVNTGIDTDQWFAQLQEKSGELLAKRRELSELRAQKVRLEARYGSIGNGMSHWDHQRKTLLAEIAEQRRADVAQSNADLLAQDPKAKPEKITEAALDDYAHAHPRYKRFLEESFGEREEYLRYRSDLDRLYGEVEHLQGVREYLVQRIRLNEEAVRHARTMANLGG